MKANASKEQFFIRLLIPVGIALLIWFIPPPQGVQIKAWHLFAIFAGTIVGLISQPLPMGGVVILGVTTVVITHTLTADEALVGFSNPTVWLIIVAFLFSAAFAKSGFGRRIAFIFIGLFGRKTLGLAYALAMSDLVLAPGIPSGAARTGGVLFPITRELAVGYGSEPGPTADRIGKFLMLSTYHVHDITCAMFLTSMAANPLIAELALKSFNITITWGSWALATLVPGLLSLLILPYMLFKILKPEITETPEAPEMAKRELAKMGPISRQEIVVLCVFILVLLLWLTGSWTKLEATPVAFVGLGILLLTGVLDWHDILKDTRAWDALVWFGGLVGMATMLGKLGLLKWFAGFVGANVAGLPWLPTLLLLLLVYFYAHYCFASLTAHVTAMYVPFLTVAVAAGAPAQLAALSLAFFSSLCVCLTHYGGGPAPIFFGAGYVDVKKWWSVGFIVSLLFLVIWLGIAPFYWKILGLY